MPYKNRGCAKPKAWLSVWRRFQERIFAWWPPTALPAKTWWQNTLSARSAAGFTGQRRETRRRHGLTDDAEGEDIVRQRRHVLQRLADRLNHVWVRLHLTQVHTHHALRQPVHGWAPSDTTAQPGEGGAATVLQQPAGHAIAETIRIAVCSRRRGAALQQICLAHVPYARGDGLRGSHGALLAAVRYPSCTSFLAPREQRQPKKAPCTAGLGVRCWLARGRDASGSPAR
jgi:hypothetical protein